MSNELVINSTPKGLRIALLNDKELIECHFEDDSKNYHVGDLYLGTVTKVMPGLNAAFVDVGYEKDAFLHYLDLGPNFRSLMKYSKAVLAKKEMPSKLTGFKFEPEIDKLGKVSNVLAKNQRVLVQIVKEPISTKGPRLSCEISLAGRYIVLVPFSNTVSVSRKIADGEERNRLSRLIQSIKPENFGVIVRTVAQGKEVAELDKDLRNLLDKWAECRKNMKLVEHNERVLGEVDRASSIIRDMLNESFESIVTDDQQMYEDIKAYIHDIAPEKEKIVKFHSGKSKLFEAKGIERQLKTLFGRSVSIPGGGYLIIEHTEALHVIDVNSGNKSNTESDQESTAVSTNIQAVKEIARQLRLRDMGGIIVADFIDMKNPDNRKLIYDRMKEELETDKAKSVVLPLSKFGLMQITRQRVRPEVNIATGEDCPTCNGTGKIGASIAITDTIEGNIDYILTKQNEKKITLVVHPFLEAFYTKGFPSLRMKWFFKYKKWVNIEVDSSRALVDFSILNTIGEEIEML